MTSPGTEDIPEYNPSLDKELYIIGDFMKPKAFADNFFGMLIPIGDSIETTILNSISPIQPFVMQGRISENYFIPTKSML